MRNIYLIIIKENTSVTDKLKRKINRKVRALRAKAFLKSLRSDEPRTCWLYVDPEVNVNPKGKDFYRDLNGSLDDIVVIFQNPTDKIHILICKIYNMIGVQLHIVCI